METNDNIELLNAAAQNYEQVEFIDNDPIQIPRKFTKKEDIEIAGLIAATLAWGQRPQIIKKSLLWMELLNWQPYDFVMNAPEEDFKRFTSFVYRTFNGDDCLFFMYSLRNIYKNHGGLEAVFSKYPDDMKQSITYFREVFTEIPHLKRSEKHIGNPQKGSAAKRINMYLRWMVRSADRGVDFGLWKEIKSSALMIPLDVHSGRMGRKFGLLQRKQDDWKAVDELTINLRKLDPNDPIKYDFALFGMGVNSK